MFGFIEHLACKSASSVTYPSKRLYVSSILWFHTSVRSNPFSSTFNSSNVETITVMVDFLPGHSDQRVFSVFGLSKRDCLMNVISLVYDWVSFASE